jgi:hypothetical protein
VISVAKVPTLIDHGFPGSQNFHADISHWLDSSSQVPVCSVEPGTPSDVGQIVSRFSCYHRTSHSLADSFRTITLQLKQIGLARVPFAVKSGGHATNPGFSSTNCVHISMARFKEIVIHEDSGTVEIGPGLTWTDVYEYLVPKGLNVVGGRLNGVGVAGFTLGGGKSLLPVLTHLLYGRDLKGTTFDRIFLEI